MFVESSVVSHVGRIRKNNEDNFFFNGFFRKDTLEDFFAKMQKVHEKRLVYAVCDGMGGEEYGEIASLCAVSLMGIFKENKWSENIFKEYIDKVKTEMISKCSGLLAQRMGTTFALLYLEDNTAHIANMGDSRIYLYRNNKLLQISKDHTQASLLIDNGLLTPDKVSNHKSSHILTRYLGTENEITEKDIYQAEEIKLCKDDIFLLCSDGLTDMLADEQIEKILSKSDKNTKKAANKLCMNALNAGGKDNITCIIVKIKKNIINNLIWKVRD